MGILSIRLLFIYLWLSMAVMMPFVSAEDYGDKQWIVSTLKISNDFFVDYMKSGSFLKSVNATLLSLPLEDSRQDVIASVASFGFNTPTFRSSFLGVIEKLA